MFCRGSRKDLTTYINVLQFMISWMCNKNKFEYFPQYKKELMSITKNGQNWECKEEFLQYDAKNSI